MADSKPSGGGIGVLGMLGILFVGLKLTGYIDWSWWWVTAPFWGGIALILVAISGYLLVVGALDLISSFVDKRAEKARKESQRIKL